MLERIAYIASVGYSGSTLLDMLIGNSPEATSLGEVYLLSRYARENANCTCGAPVRECPFWNRVEEKLRVRTGDHNLRLAEFPLTVEAKIQSLNRKLPTLNDALLVLGNRSMWRTFRGVSSVSQAYARASRNALRVFEAVADLNQTPLIVDSSKYALPMKAQYMEAPDKMKVIMLVRDGRATSLSLVRRQRMTFEQAVHTWRRYNWNLELAMRTIPAKRKMLLRYEELCMDPAGTLEQISRFLGTQTPIRPGEIRKDAYHNIGGNPMRFRRGENEIVLDEKWRREITPEQISKFDRIAGKLNRSFGYF